MSAEHAKGPVSEWYDGRSVFITGGSGFMGKVLVEKLLYSCSKIKCIYILLRGKRGRTPAQRVADMWKLPVFERLRKLQPDAVNKIRPLTGDLYADNLGLSDVSLKLMIENVSVVFHCGATLKLDANLKDAIEQNTLGTARLLDISKKMKNLKAFIHYSTAFCSADLDEFEERVYESKDNPRHVIEVSKWLNEEALESSTPNIIKPHPNTYTYSKRLAETLVASEADNLPVCIIRPSIVTPSALEPVPGWVDNLNGPMGLLVGAGKGVIRSIHMKGSNPAHVVPVDMAISFTIVAAQKLGAAKTKPKEVPVYNLTQDAVIPITFRKVLETGRAIAYKYPFEGQIWYPDGDMRSSKFIHNIYCLFFHWLPALLIDLILFVLRQKTFMIRLNKKIQHGLELLEFFTTRQWHFRSEKFLGLMDELTEEDKIDFPLDFNALPIEEYLKYCILGARQYCMKEDLSTLPRARRHQTVMYVIHKICVWAFYIGITWYLINLSPTLRGFVDKSVIVPLTSLTK